MKRIMNKIKEKSAVICAFLLCITSIAAMAGCGKLPSSFVTSDKIKVVCTTFPQYDWVRQILGENGDEFEIKLLTDNGVDMHSYQPSTADIAAVASCDVLVYTGGTSENWVTSALKEAVNPDMTVVNLMDYLGDSVKEEELAEGMQGDSHGHTHSHAQEDDDHDEAHDGSHDHGEEHHHEDEIEYDEHIWLSVKNAEKIVEELTNVLAGKDTKHAQAIRENASAYQSRLNELDTQYAQLYRAQSMTPCCLVTASRSAIWLTITESITMRHLRGAVRKLPQALKRSFFYREKSTNWDCPKCW